MTYWEASPSPVSPSNMNENVSGSSRTIAKSGSTPRSSWAAIQRRRSSFVGSPRILASVSLRHRHNTDGRIQDSGTVPLGINPAQVPTSEQVQPASTAELREERARGVATAER